MGQKLARRTFIKTGGVPGVNTLLGNPLIPDFAAGSEKIDLAIAQGTDYAQSTKQAVAMLGEVEQNLDNLRFP